MTMWSNPWTCSNSAPGCAPSFAAHTATPSKHWDCGDLCLDPAARQVRCKGEIVTLSQREYDLLHSLMRSSGRVLTREQLEQQMYSWGYEVESNAIEVHIHHLRKKLGVHAIQTVRGVGYTMADSTSRKPA